MLGQLSELMTEAIKYITEAEGFIKYFTDFTKANPVVGGYIAIVVSGLLAYIFKTIPMKIYNSVKYFLDRYFTVTITLDNGHRAFYHLVSWYEKNKKIESNRTTRVTNGLWGYEDSQISLGYGNHYFWHNKWFFKLNRNKLESQGSERQKEEISIKTAGISQKRLIELIKDTIPKEKKKNHLYTYSSDGWSQVEEVPSRKLDSVILKEGQKEKIIGFIKEFEDSKQWYNDMGISYKTGIILSGPPGTGKTSIVKALSNHLEKNLCIIGCNSVGDAAFMKALTTIPKNSIVLMEDFDSIKSIKDRGKKKESGIVNIDTDFEILSLSGILNAIDGVFSNDGRILIATTNVIDDLDPAILRPGRFDLKEEIGYMNEDMTIRMFKKFFPDFNLEKVTIKEGISPAQVENCFLENKKDPEAALKMLNELESGKVVKKISYSQMYKRESEEPQLTTAASS